MSKIFFHFEEINKIKIEVTKIRKWIKSICESENHKISTLNYIFCDDEYLLKINQNYLQHDYYTDVITFDYSETEYEIFGDIFVSLDRIKENAKENNHNFEIELYRILIHGLLHLLGYDDKTSETKNIMTNKENELLKVFHVEH